MTKTRIKERIRAITSQHFVRVIIESRSSYSSGLAAYLADKATVEDLHAWWRCAAIKAEAGLCAGLTPRQRLQSAALEDLAMAAYVVESEPNRAEYAEQLVENGVCRLYEAITL